MQLDNMAKKMLIDATHAEETRVVVVDGNKVEEFDFESENKRQLAGNIYLAKITRVEPSLQAAFVDYGGNRHGFLAFSEIHPDYYQIPIADREALMAEEQAYADSLKARDEDEEKPKPRGRGRGRGRSKAENVKTEDAVETQAVEGDIQGMEAIDLDDDAPEGSSPMELVAETPVETPAADEEVADAAASEDVSAAPVDEADAEVAAEKASDDDEVEAPVKGSKAAAKDDTIETVADEDDEEDIRPVRKPRPRRYKIQEVIKVRQILLVQVVKEERGNKGAALTTYLSLAGRYCVLMPNTARGGGISRKITNAADRKKLKEIANEIEVPKGAGLIVRTAGAQRTKPEIKRDYEYLQRLWEQIRELTLKSIAPAKIYEEGDLIKRSIRDLYNRDIDEVFVEGERGYRIAKDFMKMIMPSHAVNVKHYRESLPLFARFQVETYLAGMFNPTVQLKSGGYIVIGVTEALVAIDVNSGRATKEGSIEDTATKTNLEASDEVARQLRLRDLAGLIVIDFIDMDERKNNAAVEKRMKDRLKTDRARIQVGRISGFGLMEMSRQRLRPGMIEATTQPCAVCHGTGLIRSDDNLALSILRQIEEEGTRRRSREVLVKAPVGIANFLMNQKREHIAQIEGRYGLSVRVEGDPHLVSPDFALEKFKTATRVVPAASSPVVSGDISIMDQIDETEAELVTASIVEDAPSAEPELDAEGKPKRRRRRRRRRGGKGNNGGEGQTEVSEENGVESTPSVDGAVTGETVVPAAEPVAEPAAEKAPEAEAKNADVKPEVAEEAPAKKKVTRTRSPRTAKPRGKAETAKAAEEATPASEAGVDAVAEPVVDSAAEAAPVKPKRTRKPAAPRTKKPKVEAEVSAPADPVVATEPVMAEPAPVPDPAPAPEPIAAAAVASTEPAKPKRRGWWSLGK